MNRNQWLTLAGIGLGLLGAGVGLLGLATWWHLQNGDSIRFFIEEVFLRGSLYQDSILTVSVLADVVLFYGLMRANREALARGVMVVVLAAVPLVIYLQIVNLPSA